MFPSEHPARNVFPITNTIVPDNTFICMYTTYSVSSKEKTLQVVYKAVDKWCINCVQIAQRHGLNP